MLTMIVAFDRNRAIGRDGELPWRQSSDLQRFKRLTMGCAIVMGRATYESIGRPLPGRRNIVLSRNLEWSAEGIETMSVEEVIALGRSTEAFIIGGGQIYRLFMSYANALEVTIVDTEVEDADVWFPDFSGFSEVSRSPATAGENDDHAMEFVRLERVDGLESDAPLPT